MTRTHSHRSIDVTLNVNALPGRRMKWSFATSTSLFGDGVTAFGVEAAFRDAIRAAEDAIDGAMDG